MNRVLRHIKLKEYLENNPFATDEDLSKIFSVSIPTIRLDRQLTGIPEYKQRLKNAAVDNLSKPKAISENEFIGELISLEIGKNAVATLKTGDDMVFSKTKIVKGQYVYSFAETLAISVIDAQAALVEVANIKYISPISAGENLVALADVKEKRENKNIVWVRIKQNNIIKFRGKFILTEIV